MQIASTCRAFAKHMAELMIVLCPLFSLTSILYSIWYMVVHLYSPSQVCFTTQSVLQHLSYPLIPKHLYVGVNVVPYLIWEPGSHLYKLKLGIN